MKKDDEGQSERHTYAAERTRTIPLQIDHACKPNVVSLLLDLVHLVHVLGQSLTLGESKSVCLGGGVNHINV
jgi:hypothetical protein